MGSWYDLRVDGLSVWGGKSVIEDAILALFQERDRRVRPNPNGTKDEGDSILFEYAVTVQAMRERLDVLGFSADRARVNFDRGKAEEVELYEGIEDSNWPPDALVAKIQSKTYERWQLALQKMEPLGYQSWMFGNPKWAGDADAALLGSDGGVGLGSYFSEPRFLLRGVIDALPTAREVVLDYSDLVGGGYFDADEPICANARVEWASQPANGPIVLLTEGRSDSRILTAAFETIAPHLADFYSFLDFEALKIQGSTDGLAKMVRAFVGARVSMRVIAIFDNDTAGAAGLRSLSDVSLPANVKAMLLPPSAIAQAYPTEGPQGSSLMDVNGLAASIELYLGRDALEGEDGKLRPVRWTAYDPRMRRYQGAIDEKHHVEEKFLAMLRTLSSSANARSALPELAVVIDSIVRVFRDAD